MYMDRPAVAPDVIENTVGFLADFGAHDDAVLDIVFGKFNPTGILPFEIPSSMEAVEKQFEDVPYDSENPVFPFGHGLSYTTFQYNSIQSSLSDSLIVGIGIFIVPSSISVYAQ